ncbi:hypothetical protein A2690_01275 [Candidatus Roizmanbacteria bacterium RIFCSPHIGHO2_01_FULL_39_12b]|uniref:Glycosyltransferase 2-like domain-containing protein n=1 Tax=Candidatus Roizmanbacteria bacterium RIFCSPHIGHO2_01_FULL_39_12b TaxID=1802030 RepID=A0A1F7GAU7_9BACT|nr:MAG: hypothetical protein A2690_01275 [Candidatus Roizmanbacteria bacterium RIFCSPHIGHO2_01_FULL_39_12b]OGK46074.1 MAG: hypothetical protein A3B46_01180 [Candidatus Roizmanbacteria bacterium RIFCSPLOWO2_01_FULL_39_19]
MLSVVVLARNEEKNIEGCLKSLGFCDEVLVIDDDSTDKTVEIAKKHEAKVIPRKLNDDFASQRNFALSKTVHDWVLYIDADEKVTDDLIQETAATLKNNPAATAFYLRRRDFFWGRELKYGETQTARNRGILRLVKKGTGQWKGKVHEEWETQGETARFSNFIDHYPHQTIISFLRTINDYSSKRAEELYKNSVKTSVLSIFFNPLSKFIYTYFIKFGFLDGPAGFVYSFMMSFHSFLVRAKLFLR